MRNRRAIEHDADTVPMLSLDPLSKLILEVLLDIRDQNRRLLSGTTQKE
jgi:hypothetical protein